jgi:hypothetical protein
MKDLAGTLVVITEAGPITLLSYHNSLSGDTAITQ